MIVAGVMTGTSVDGIGWVYSFNFIEKTKVMNFEWVMVSVNFLAIGRFFDDGIVN